MSAKCARTRSWVPSVDPVSTITHVLMYGRTESRHRRITCASFFTIMLRQTDGIGLRRGPATATPRSLAEPTRCLPMLETARRVTFSQPVWVGFLLTAAGWSFAGGSVMTQAFLLWS